MTTVIIENEKDSQSLLKKILNEFCPQVEILSIVGSVNAAKHQLKQHQPDFVFLDIQIDGGTAFDLLDQMEEREFEVIFTTAYDEYAVKAFKYEALHYILKPYNPIDIQEAISRITPQIALTQTNILAGLRNEIRRLRVNTNSGFQLYDIDKIIRVEADRSYCNIYLEDELKITISKPLSHLEQQLKDYNFFRSHESHLINLDKLVEYDSEEGNFLLMSDQTKVPLARRRKSEIINILKL